MAGRLFFVMLNLFQHLLIDYEIPDQVRNDKARQAGLPAAGGNDKEEGVRNDKARQAGLPAAGGNDKEEGFGMTRQGSV